MIKYNYQSNVIIWIKLGDLLVLSVLMDLIWMFGAFFLILWNMKSPLYDLEELVE